MYLKSKFKKDSFVFKIFTSQKSKTKSNNPFMKIDPLYHEYSFFGIKNKQTQGHFVKNQRAKAPIITAYIALAIAKARD